MYVTRRLIFLIGMSLIQPNNSLSSFDLTLQLDDIDNHFRFVQTMSLVGKNQIPTVIYLDDDDNPTIINPSLMSSIQTYHVESDRNSMNMATVVDRNPLNSNLVFAIVQISNGSIYDIAPSMTMTATRSRRSLNEGYVIKHDGEIIQGAHVTIDWPRDRPRRAAAEEEVTRLPASEQMTSSTLPSATLPDTLENVTIPSADNDTESLLNSTTKEKVPRPIPEKSRHLYLEIVALVDSLILNDVRTILNKTDEETIEILKIYYVHIFTGIEQVYRQSLIYETLDVHIRLTKIIFATNKHRLPWESFKNISSLADIYRKFPNDVHTRPNMSMNVLKSLHNAYTSSQFDTRFFANHADHVMTFTRFDLLDGAGSAYVLGMCLSSYKYSIIQEDLNAFSVMLTAAHELGHNLGLNHDETENSCDQTDARYIMSPKNVHTHDRPQLPLFSECSISQLNDFANNSTTTCWKNPIVSTRNDSKFDRIREMVSSYLGEIFDLHTQCQLQYGPRSIPYISVIYHKNQTLYEENICNQLRCFKKPEDEFMFWQDGAFDGTPCGENRICQKKQCVSTNQTKEIIVKDNQLENCPYGDLFVPVPLLNLMKTNLTGNLLCSNAFNLLRSHGMNIKHLCYDSVLPFRRLCCEECKKHSIPECGDIHPHCSMFAQYCDDKYVRVNGQFMNDLCAYTCGQCPNLPPPPKPTTTTTTTTTTKTTTTKASKSKSKPALVTKALLTKKTTTTTTTKRVKSTTPSPPKRRQYVKPTKFDEHTCIDAADCSQLTKVYAKLKKNVKNWCSEVTIMVNGRYFAEMCPKYCSLCNITSECDRYRLCRNNGTCIKDEHGTYQCLCPSSNAYYGTLCEYRRTCLKGSCSSKTEFCLQTRGEDYLCISKTDKESLRIILDGKN